ncbi:uncharacterized protein LOC135203668 isoform X1 [Macrobrachium nipponense]|uniref:uncharacterized protein LOC135203668 isoform X1 n=1 Tax=Macrobrachium nipponense TaxID=159736 RepID=UPI0030C7DD44
MEEKCFKGKEEEGNDLWLTRIPIPKMLELAVHQLTNKNLPTHFIEDVLPSLCFSLPPNSGACCRILQSLPESSPVWGSLQEGVATGKYLPPGMMAALYRSRPSFLEGNIFSVLRCYVQSTAACERYEISNFTIKHFKDSSRSSCSLFDRKIDVMNSEDSQNLPEVQIVPNFWRKSFIVDAAVCSEEVFIMCLRIFFKVAVDVQFSLTYMLSVHDFFAVLFCRLDKELFKVFPSNLQHVVYLLTLPLYISDGATLENTEQVPVIQDSLLRLVQDEGISVVRTLLCFFPYWLPALSCSQFLDNYLKFIPKDEDETVKVESQSEVIFLV